MLNKVPNIIVIGCSWSKWGDNDFFSNSALKKDSVSSWPLLLSEQYDCNVENFSLLGNSIAFQFYTFLEILKNYKLEEIDLIILQITSFYRQSFKISNSKFQNTNIKEDLKTITPKYRSLKCDRIEHHNPYAPAKFFNLGNKSFFRRLCTMNAKYSINAAIEFEIAWIDKILILCKEKNIPCLPWQYRNGHNFWAYEKAEFILEKELSNKLWQKFIVDEGKHFNTKGQQYILDHFLLDRIRKYVQL